jgi:DNA repair photolyase
MRDLDLFAPLAAQNLAHVAFLMTSLDHKLSSRLEPCASAPHARLRAMKALSDAGVPIGVMFAPAIPWVNDAHLEAVLEAARDAGYVLLPLPHEVAPVFRATRWSLGWIGQGAG